MSKEMSDIQKIDLLEKGLARLLSWIQAAESRLVFILPLSTAMLGVIAAFAPTKLESWTIQAAISTSFTLVSIGASLFCAGYASWPRTNGPDTSLIFFGKIQRLTIEEYLTKITSLTTGNYIKDLSDQCHRNAEIASEKFKWINKSLLFLLSSSLLWAWSIWVLYNLKTI